MTKAELAQDVSNKTGFEASTVKIIIEAATRTIIKTNVSGEGVYIRGFGSFTPKQRKKKIGRNITAGTSVVIPAHKIASFKPSPNFAGKIKNS
jgi:DNA-binding protein HU-beta